MKNVYNEGLHILSTLKDVDKLKLQTYEAFRSFVENQILKFNLCQLGNVYHDFQNGGFTAVVCLSESHLSIHTWPEFGLLNMDIFLSNFSKINDSIVLSLYEAFKDFFGGLESNLVQLKR